MRAGLVLALVVILGISLAATSSGRVGAVSTNKGVGLGIVRIDARSVLASLPSSAGDDFSSAPLDRRRNSQARAAGLRLGLADGLRAQLP